MIPLVVPKTIRAQLIAWFLVIALVPLLLFSGLIYRQRVQYLKSEAFNKLQAVRDLKVQRIEAWMDDVEDDLETLVADGSVTFIPDGKLPLHTSETDIREARARFDNFVRFHPAITAVQAIDASTGHRGRD